MSDAVFMLFLSLLAYAFSEDNPTIKVKVTMKNNAYSCKPEMEQYTLVEQSVTINVTHPSVFNDMWCRIKANDKTSDLPLTYKEGDITSSLVVKPDFGGIWNCTILSNKHVSTGLKRAFSRIEYSNKTKKNETVDYVAVDCLIKIHVRQSRAPQVVYVNTKLQEEEKLRQLPLSETIYDKELVHYYEDGDVLDVQCDYNSENHYRQMDYSYIHKLSISDEIHTTSIGPTGLRMRMKPEHNNTYAICKCSVYNDEFSIGVKFVLRKSEGLISVKVNGLKLKIISYQNRVFVYEYHYNPGDRLQITCTDKRKGNLTGKWIYRSNITVLDEKVSDADTDDHELTTYSNDIANGGNSTFACYLNAINKRTNSDSLIEYAKINFIMQSERQATLVTNIALLNSTHSVPAYQFYGGDEIKVLYEDGENFNMTCSKRASEVQMELCIKDPTKENQQESGNDSLSMTIDPNKFSEATCSIAADKQKIRAKFVHYVPVVVMVPSTTDQSGLFEGDTEFRLEPWHMGLACTVATLVLFGSSFFIYKMQKRNKNQDDANYENLGHGNDTPIPPIPQQWDDVYAQPGDQVPEATYSQPFHPAAAMYSTPVPKSERPPRNKTNPDPIYEETASNYAKIQTLGIKDELDRLYSKVAPKSQRKGVSNAVEEYVNADVSLNYAQVVPKSLRCPKAGDSNYANVFNGPYNNADTAAEYVEPTYCETRLNRNK